MSAGPISKARWQRIEAVFFAALDREDETREAFLRTECRDDSELREQVRRMLAGCAQSDSFLLTPDGQSLSAGSPAVDPGLAGKRIGAFRLVSPIATGGMAAVWLGERDDGVARQRVALKLLNWGLITDERRRLFHKERQVLAQLEHPYITRLIDGGTTDEGVPYLVMEYVEGLPLNRYCDEHRLPLRERIGLFRLVCEAVQYAHQNLVVHRDLKPNNILVDQRGVPKLLDFGVSKLLDETSLHGPGEATVTAVRAFTPRYASPEQIRGTAITTASDVYSLGVLLYELLSGARPYTFDGDSEFERVQQICESDPPLPSRANATTRSNGADRGQRTHADVAAALRSESPEGLGRRLRGDLDNVVMKAMRKEPAKRYASAEHLSEDLRRHLQGRPVHAHQSTLRYRLGKFVRRNAVTVTAGAAVGLSLLVAVGGITWQWRVASAERDNALAAQCESEAMTTVLQNTLFSVDPERRGGNVSLYMLLGDAVRQAELQLPHLPEALAKVRYAVGSTYAALRAERPAKRNLQLALSTYREVYGDNDPEVARCLDDLGWLLVTEGDHQGVDMLSESVAIRQRRFGADQRMVADTKCRLAYGLAAASEPPELELAERYLGEANEVYRRRFERPHECFAMHTFVEGVIAEARGEVEMAIKLYQTACDEYTATGKALPEQALVLERLARGLESRGKFGEARQRRRELTALSFRLFGDLSAHEAYWSLGRLEYKAGRYETAIWRYRDALDQLCRAWVRNASMRPAVFARQSRALNERKPGDAVSGMGQVFLDTLAVLRETGRYDDKMFATWMLDLAAAMLEAKAPDDALLLAKQALQLNADLADDRIAALGHALAALAQPAGAEANRNLRACSRDVASVAGAISANTRARLVQAYRAMGLQEVAAALRVDPAD